MVGIVSWKKCKEEGKQNRCQQVGQVPIIICGTCLPSETMIHKGIRERKVHQSSWFLYHCNQTAQFSCPQGPNQPPFCSSCQSSDQYDNVWIYIHCNYHFAIFGCLTDPTYLCDLVKIVELHTIQ